VILSDILSSHTMCAVKLSECKMFHGNEYSEPHVDKSTQRVLITVCS